MDFNTVYAQKLTTADRVAALVKDDDWVDYGWAIGTPVSFDAALAKRLPELHGIKFRGGILCHVPEIFKIENQAEHFCWNSWHMGGIERKAVAAGYAYYYPLRYSELPRYYRESPDPLNIGYRYCPPNVAKGAFKADSNKPSSRMPAVPPNVSNRALCSLKTCSLLSVFIWQVPHRLACFW